jgi:hypothetical protein
VLPTVHREGGGEHRKDVPERLAQESHAARTRIQNRKRTKGELRINDFASSYKSTSLGHPVRAKVVERDPWETLFRSQGMKIPLPRMRMLDGFNDSWIAFEGGEGGIVKGEVTLETVLRALVLAAR